MYPCRWLDVPLLPERPRAGLGSASPKHGVETKWQLASTYSLEFTASYLLWTIASSLPVAMLDITKARVL